MHQFEIRIWDPVKCKMLYGTQDVVCVNGILRADGMDQGIILLYSGRRDKNHVKVYQMDIIEHGHDLKTIVWHAGGLVAVDENSMLDSTEGWYVAEPIGNLGHDIKVVGNCFEHKHLLRRYQ